MLSSPACLSAPFCSLGLLSPASLLWFSFSSLSYLTNFPINSCLSLLDFVTLSERRPRSHRRSFHLDLVFQFLLADVFLVAYLLNHADFLSLSCRHTHAPICLLLLSLGLLSWCSAHFTFPFPPFFCLQDFFPFFMHFLTVILSKRIA